MNRYWQNLRKMFKPVVDDEAIIWKINEYEIFFEIETVLYLYETLFPEKSVRLTKLSWTLISGYYPTEHIKHNSDAKTALLNVRNNIRYVKAATSWNYWLSWYK